MASSIVAITMTNVNEVLTANPLTSMQLTNPDSIDTTIPILEAGRVEEIGGQLYQVIDGNYTPSGSPSDGVTYLYVEDTGSAIIGYLSNTAPTYTGQGFYNSNAKALFVMNKTGSVYENKSRIMQNYPACSPDGEIEAFKSVKTQSIIPTIEDDPLTIEGDLDIVGQIAKVVTSVNSATANAVTAAPPTTATSIATCPIAYEDQTVATIWNDSGTKIGMYRYSNASLELIGSLGTITAVISRPAITALDENTIAIFYEVSGGNSYIAIQRFNGSTWSQISLNNLGVLATTTQATSLALLTHEGDVYKFAYCTNGTATGIYIYSYEEGDAAAVLEYTWASAPATSSDIARICKLDGLDFIYQYEDASNTYYLLLRYNDSNLISIIDTYTTTGATTNPLCEYSKNCFLIHVATAGDRLFTYQFFVKNDVITSGGFPFRNSDFNVSGTTTQYATQYIYHIGNNLLAADTTPNVSGTDEWYIMPLITTDTNTRI